MTAAVVDSTMTSLQISSQQEARPVLRRATYVHVSDLTNVYNIDHSMLEQELKRVKAEREQVIEDEKPKTPDFEETEDDPTGASLDPALTSPQKRLQPPRGGYNLCVLVGKVMIVVDKKRVDQSRVRLAEVEIGDETGTVSLRARDDQIDLLEEVSKRSGAVVLRNCTLELYQGKHIRLAVTKWGKLSRYPDSVASTPPAPSKMNEERNFSAIDLSVVASEMVDTQSEPLFSGRLTKQSDTPDAGQRISSSKGGSQGNPKVAQTPGRKGGREKRQAKGKASSSSMHLHYGSPHASSLPSQPTPMRYASVHPYPIYDQAVDLRQYHYARQQDALLACTPAQQIMMQRQFELQQRQLHQMYQRQQDRHRAVVSSGQQGQSPGIMMQQVVPSASFDTVDYHLPTYASATSSPILIPMAMPGTHGPNSGNARIHASDVPHDTHDAIAGGNDGHNVQYMSVSPDDSSQFSQRMNPDASSFAPSYLSAAQATQHAHFPYMASQVESIGAAYPPQTHQHQETYNTGETFNPTVVRADTNSLAAPADVRNTNTRVRSKEKGRNSTSEEKMESG